MKGKLKKKLCGFSYSKSMTNFEAYRWIISTNINLLNLKKSDIMCNIHILYKFPIQFYFSKVFSSRKKLRQFFFSKNPFFQNSEMKTTSLFFFWQRIVYLAFHQILIFPYTIFSTGWFQCTFRISYSLQREMLFCGVFSWVKWVEKSPIQCFDQYNT